MASSKRVSLALGAGGARGYAHIGVIQALEERGYEIVSIAGTSMGAMIGGLYAAGKLDEYTDWVSGFTQRDVIRLLDPVIRAPGAIRGEKVVGQVADLLAGARIEDLPIPYTAVATDLVAGKEVWFQRGQVVTAIRASIALPSFISPVVINGRLLADGGLLNPIPVAATAAVPDADLTLAVALSEGARSHGGLAPVHEDADGGPEEAYEVDEGFDQGDGLLWSVAQMLDSDLTQTITRWFTSGSDVVGEDEGAVERKVQAAEYGDAPPGMRTLDVMQLSLDALQSAVARYRLAAYPPDVLITVPRNACRTLDFHRAREMIAIGRERAMAALDELATSSLPPTEPASSRVGDS
jgi:NTE family protein